VIGAVAVKLLVKLIAGVIGRKVTLAIAMAYLGIRAARAMGAGRTVRRARAWLRATRRARASQVHDANE
jgi:UPF0716 family protein affecting phage T7 exclusion